MNNFADSSDPLSLERIRSILTRLEDTIIFSLIERAQFAHNPRIYERGAFQEIKNTGFEGSWLEWFLKETEAFHGMPSLIFKLIHIVIQQIYSSQSKEIY
jgi:chorismate mutase